MHVFALPFLRRWVEVGTKGRREEAQREEEIGRTEQGNRFDVFFVEKLFTKKTPPKQPISGKLLITCFLKITLLVL